MPTAETCGDNSHELQLLQTNKEADVMEAFRDLRKDASWNNDQKLSEIVNNYCENSVKTVQFCEALQKRLEDINEQSLVHAASFHGDPFIVVDKLLNDFACVYGQEQRMNESLQSFDNCLAKKVHRIDVWKKVCDVFFTAAAVISAAAATFYANSNKMAAAAYSALLVLFGTLGKWMNSFLKKRDCAEKKHKKIVGNLILSSDISIKDLNNIRDLAVEAKSMWELADDDVDVRQKVAAVIKSLQTLKGKAEDYNRKWAARQSTSSNSD